MVRMHPYLPRSTDRWLAAALRTSPTLCTLQPPSKHLENILKSHKCAFFNCWSTLFPSLDWLIAYLFAISSTCFDSSRSILTLRARWTHKLNQNLADKSKSNQTVPANRKEIVKRSQANCKRIASRLQTVPFKQFVSNQILIWPSNHRLRNKRPIMISLTIKML